MGENKVSEDFEGTPPASVADAVVPPALPMPLHIQIGADTRERASKLRTAFERQPRIPAMSQVFLAFMEKFGQNVEALSSGAVPFDTAVKSVQSEIYSNLAKLPAHCLKEVLEKDFPHLLELASPSNRNVATRHLARALSDRHIELFLKMREKMDVEHAGVEHPGVGGAIKAGFLGGVRGVKNLKRDSNVDAERKKRADELENRRNVQHELRSAFGPLTREFAAGLREDHQLNNDLENFGNRVLARLAQGRKPDQIDKLMADLEDFFSSRDTDELMQFAGRLLESAPSRLAENEGLNLAGKALQSVLATRYEANALVEALNRPLSGGATPEAIDEYRSARIGRMVADMANSPADPAVRGKLHFSATRDLHLLHLMGETPENMERHIRGLSGFTKEQLVRAQDSIRAGQHPADHLLNRLAVTMGEVAQSRSI